MRAFRPKFFVIGIAAAGALGAAASGDPTALRIRVPAPLAKRIAQQSLARPLPNGDSHVEFDVKKPIDALVKRVDISKVDEVLRVYGNGLFGLNFEKPFQLAIKVHGVKIAGDFRIREIRFSQAKDGRGGRRLGVIVNLDIPNVVVSAREVWAHERGLTPDQKTAGAACGATGSGNRAFDAFAGNRIWARDFGPSVAKRKNLPAKADPVIHAVGRFRAEIVDAPGGGGRLELVPVGIDLGREIERVLGSYYELREGRIQLPKIQVQVDGECFPAHASTRDAVQALFHSLREDLKREIVKGVVPDIRQAALDEARKALADLEIPAAKGFRFVADPDPILLPATIEPTRIDHTYVRPAPRLLTLESTASRTDAKAAPVAGNPKPIAGVLWEIEERLKAENFSVGADGALEVGLSDSLRLNGRAQSAVSPYDTGGLPAQSPDAIRVILNRAFFEAKTELIESLKREQAALLPPEIALAPEGIELRPSASGRLSLVAHAEIRLKRLDGLKKAFYYLEKIAGNPTGTLKIPAQLDLVPSVATGAGGARKLVLRATLNANLLRNDFGQRSDLGRIYPKITEFLPAIRREVDEKVAEAAAKLNEKPIELDLAPLEAKSPLRLERVLFTSAGSLVVDLSAPSLPEFVKAAKERKRERRAKETGRD